MDILFLSSFERIEAARASVVTPRALAATKSSSKLGATPAHLSGTVTTSKIGDIDIMYTYCQIDHQTEKHVNNIKKRFLQQFLMMIQEDCFILKCVILISRLAHPPVTDQFLKIF